MEMHKKKEKQEKLFAMGTSAHMKLYKSMAMSYRTLYDNSLVASTVRKIELCFC